MKQYIKAEIQNMSKSEILTLIPQDTLDRIKKSDKRPEFKVFCVGHEGVATSQEISMGGKMTKAFQYMRDMIFRIVDRMKYGMPIFNQHGITNSHDGREPIGELVGKTVKTIGDKVSALAAMYIYPQYRKMDLDVASIEADVEYTPKGSTGGDVIDVEDITGIALSSSKINKPAFPGATLLGIVQAFAKSGEKGTGMNKQEIIDAIKEGGYKITEIFTNTEIIESAPAKGAMQSQYEEGKRLKEKIGKLSEEKIDLEAKITTQDGKIKKLNEAVSGTHTKTLFEKVCEVRKFNDKEKAYIEKKLGGFKSEKEGDDLKIEFDRFIDAQKTDFDETVKLLGADPGKPPAGTGAGTGTGSGAAGGGSDDGKGGGTDLTDPKNNDYIPT